VREAKGNIFGNRYLLHGSFFIYVSSEPFESKVNRDRRDDEGGGGEVREMFREKADTVLGNSLCPDRADFF
jgi:hypothetical protein